MTVKWNPISSEDNFRKVLLSDIIHCVINRINKKNTEMWKKGFDEIQHPIMIKKKTLRKIITEGHILNLTIIYKKTHSWHCPWWWKAKCFLPETRNKVRISTYITLLQHWAGNASFTSMTESSLHPALVGSSLGSLSALFIWRSILNDFFFIHPLSNSSAKSVALPSKWLQNTTISPVCSKSLLFLAGSKLWITQGGTASPSSLRSQSDSFHV